MKETGKGSRSRFDALIEQDDGCIGTEAHRTSKKKGMSMQWRRKETEAGSQISTKEQVREKETGGSTERKMNRQVFRSDDVVRGNNGSNV